MESRASAGWQRPALVAIAIAGIAISIYLTATHLSTLPLVCTIGSVVNCASVTHSAYSVIPRTSIPISVLGIIWFAVSGTLPLVSPRRFPPPTSGHGPGPPAHASRGGVAPREPRSSAKRAFETSEPAMRAFEALGGGLPALQLSWAGLGVVVVLYLVFVEIVILHEVCEWCTVVHLLVVATFVLTLRQFQQA